MVLSLLFCCSTVLSEHSLHCKAKHCTTKITLSYELAEVVSKQSTKTKPEKDMYTDRESFRNHEEQHTTKIMIIKPVRKLILYS